MNEGDILYNIIIMIMITILGRGESLKKLDKFESDCGDVILVNEFWKTSQILVIIIKYLKF